MRNGYYEEALDLSAHVRRMAKKHGTIPIIEVCPWCTCNHMGCRWGVPIAIKKSLCTSIKHKFVMRTYPLLPSPGHWPRHRTLPGPDALPALTAVERLYPATRLSESGGFPQENGGLL